MKNEVEVNWGPKFLNVMWNTAKVYFCTFLEIKMSHLIENDTKNLVGEIWVDI